MENKDDEVVVNMPLLSCILLSHLFLMPLQLSAIVILFSELVPTLFDTELAVFFIFLLSNAYNHIFFLLNTPLFPTRLFHCLPFSSLLYVDSPVSKLSNYPCSSFFWSSFGWILACFFSSFLKIQACFISYLATVHIVTPSERHWTAIAVLMLEIVS